MRMRVDGKAGTVMPGRIWTPRDCNGGLATCSPGHRPRRRRHSTVQQLLHRLGGRISELSRSGDLNLLAACRVAPLASRRLLDFELSKSWKRNLLGVRSRSHDALSACCPQSLALASCSRYAPLQFSRRVRMCSLRASSRIKRGALSHSVEALSLRLMTRRSGASGIGNNLRLKLDSSW